MPQPFLHFGDVAFMGEGENGPVTHALQHDCSAALYVGDDVTDEDVFALRDARILTVRIGRKNVPRLGIFYKDRQKSPRCFGCSSRSPTKVFTPGVVAMNRQSLILLRIPTNSLSSILELASFSMR